MGWQPNYQSEAHIYAKYLLKEMPDAKIAVLYQNDDYGKDYLKGLKDGLGAKAASMIVAEESYETTEPYHRQPYRQAEIERRRRVLRRHHAEIRGAGDQEGRRSRVEAAALLNNVGASVGSVIKPAGFDHSQGIISAAYLKDVSDPQWDNDPGMKTFLDFLAKDLPDGNKLDASVVVGYSVAQTMVQVLKQCGDDLTRENVMRQAANLKDFPRSICCFPVSRSTPPPADFAPISQLQLQAVRG